MAPPRKKNGSMDWEGIIQSSENPNGMMAQTPDSTVRNYDGLGPQDWHWNQKADGERWNDGFQPKPDMLGTGVPVGTSKPRRKR